MDWILTVPNARWPRSRYEAIKANLQVLVKRTIENDAWAREGLNKERLLDEARRSRNLLLRTLLASRSAARVRGDAQGAAQDDRELQRLGCSGAVPEDPPKRTGRAPEELVGLRRQLVCDLLACGLSPEEIAKELIEGLGFPANKAKVTDVRSDIEQYIKPAITPHEFDGLFPQYRAVRQAAANDKRQQRGSRLKNA